VEDRTPRTIPEKPARVETRTPQEATKMIDPKKLLAKIEEAEANSPIIACDQCGLIAKASEITIGEYFWHVHGHCKTETKK